MRVDLRTLITLTLVVAGCSLPAPVPPPAEFLVSASDATYWVQSGARGFHIRRSPLILARTSGKFYELYVEEVDRSYAQALFTGERVFRRDLRSVVDGQPIPLASLPSPVVPPRTPDSKSSRRRPMTPLLLGSTGPHRRGPRL